MGTRGYCIGSCIVCGIRVCDYQVLKVPLEQLAHEALKAFKVPLEQMARMVLMVFEAPMALKACKANVVGEAFLTPLESVCVTNVIVTEEASDSKAVFYGDHAKNPASNPVGAPWFTILGSSF